MSTQTRGETSAVTHSKFFFGWVIVAVCTLLIAVASGLLYSYSVFFKPLADYFSWDRATVSFIYSASLLIRGAVSIGVGWLADRYGAMKLSIFCGFMVGLGLVLSSQVQNLWQFFLTYAVIEAIGLSGAFGIGTSIVSRWFTRNRGLAIGIVSMGSGLGTLFIVPGVERVINVFSWSQTFMICGIAGGIFMVAASFALRSAPQTIVPVNEKQISKMPGGEDSDSQEKTVTLSQAIRNPKMLLILTIFFFFIFCVQTIMVHLINYATDIGVTPLMAAALISIVGAVSIAGRLSTGFAVDKIGLNNVMLAMNLFMVASYIILIFSSSLWSFYVFAVFFGFAYGGEVPQVPLVVQKYFGTKTMATLVGLVLFAGNIGGSFGPWMAGKIFDTTRSYHWAFIVGAIASILSLIPVLILKKQSREKD